jgi:hypothetical protein
LGCRLLAAGAVGRLEPPLGSNDLALRLRLGGQRGGGEGGHRVGVEREQHVRALARDGQQRALDVRLVHAALRVGAEEAAAVEVLEEGLERGGHVGGVGQLGGCGVRMAAGGAWIGVRGRAERAGGGMAPAGVNPGERRQARARGPPQRRCRRRGGMSPQGPLLDRPAGGREGAQHRGG